MQFVTTRYAQDTELRENVICFLQPQFMSGYKRNQKILPAPPAPQLREMVLG